MWAKEENDYKKDDVIAKTVELTINDPINNEEKIEFYLKMNQCICKKQEVLYFLLFS